MRNATRWSLPARDGSGRTSSKMRACTSVRRAENSSIQRGLAMCPEQRRLLLRRQQRIHQRPISPPWRRELPSRPRRPCAGGDDVIATSILNVFGNDASINHQDSLSLRLPPHRAAQKRFVGLPLTIRLQLSLSLVDSESLFNVLAHRGGGTCSLPHPSIEEWSFGSSSTTATGDGTKRSQFAFNNDRSFHPRVNATCAPDLRS
mmetsp:Transcript_6226/g.16922  ORF Transcript_6226/g.16922 Transcript_6226/m.16922 type:complete len:204 (-) Transcript_6226:211-822(-)